MHATPMMTDAANEKIVRCDMITVLRPLPESSPRQTYVRYHRPNYCPKGHCPNGRLPVRAIHLGLSVWGIIQDRACPDMRPFCWSPERTIAGAPVNT